MSEVKIALQKQRLEYIAKLNDEVLEGLITPKLETFKPDSIFFNHIGINLTKHMNDCSKEKGTAFLLTNILQNHGIIYAWIIILLHWLRY